MICNSNGKCWEPTGANVQAAIDDLDSGTVWLPAGTLEITQDLEPGNNTRVIGRGVGVTIIESNQADIYSIQLTNKSNVTLADLTVDMNELGGHAIDIKNSHNIIVENIHIRNPGAAGFKTRDNSSFIFVSNVYVDNVEGTPTNQKHGFTFLQPRDSVFSDLIVTNVKDGCGVDVAEAANSTWNNIIIKNTTNGMKVTGTAWETRNCNFNNINIIDTQGTDCGLKILYTRNSNFNNINIIDANWNGLAVFSTAEKINLNNFHIHNSGNIGLSLDGSEINVNNGVVKDSSNDALKIYGEGVRVSNSQFINPGNRNRITSAKEVLISNSFFTGGSSHALRISDTQDLILSNSHINENSGIGVYLYDDSGPNTDFLVSDNVITDNGERGVYVSNAAHDRYIITNNVVNNHSISQITDQGSGSDKLVEDNLT